MKFHIFRISIVAMSFVLQACVGVQTFPGAARSGDTITLALGSLEGANTSNITLTFTSDIDGTVVDLTTGIRSVFNVYADKTSRMNIQATNYSLGGAANRADVLAYASAHSAWLTIAVVDLPLGLTVGSGQVSVVYGPAIRPVNNAISAESITIGLEVIAGQGNADSFDYLTNSLTSSPGNLQLFEPKKQVVVRSPILGTNYIGTKVYAAEFVLNVPLVNKVDATVAIPDGSLMIIRDVNRYDYVQSSTFDGLSNEIAAQTQMMWSRSGDLVTVRFVSPTGMLNDNFIRFSIVPSSVNDFSIMPTLVSVIYFDQTGNQVTGMQPILEQVNF